jgi:mRNA interferase MazF
MAKVRDNSVLMNSVKQKLLELQNIIEDMTEKRGELFTKWLEVQNKYLHWELRFNPKKLKRYKRKEVVHIQFGFNTGSEHGGPHWAVVIEGNNKQSSPTVIVIPLGSLKEGERVSDVHPDDVYLGKIPGINDKLVFALPNQLRAISKLRIITPRLTEHQSYEITNEQLDAIDQKMYEIFFKNSKQFNRLVSGTQEVAAGRHENP